MSSDKKYTLVVKGLPEDIYDDVIRPFTKERKASSLVSALLAAYRDNDEVRRVVNVMLGYEEDFERAQLQTALDEAQQENERLQFMLDSLTMRTQQGLSYFEQVAPAQPQVVVQAPPAQPEQSDRIDKLESLVQDLLRTQQKPSEPQQVQGETTGSDEESPWAFPTGDNEDDFAPRTDDTPALPAVDDPEPAPEPVDTANAVTFFGNLLN
ncbi:MAG: hypothetical protein HXO64_09200 [Rothia mucilaginosa]|uniref:Uncharacterized protein n=1 Tax=Rothia mucilaginosa TaxID=43675 RepID=A0A930L6G1_9MICC|nr:hypothetical protein [Rothia mucilaginosa]MBF1664694.1 hypothetical protein [Rothia mucilaginosa]